jgi:ATP-dependent Clp protease protease subunit
MNQNHFQFENLEPKGLGLVPMVIETSGRGERAYDIYSFKRTRCILGWRSQ